jgi:hypothetical protein
VRIYYAVVMAMGMAAILLLEFAAVSIRLAGPAVGFCIGTLWAGCQAARRRR